MTTIEKPTNDATEKRSNDVIAELKTLLSGKETYFPVRLCARYPKVAEKIYLLWYEPALLHKYFTELMTSDRIKRDGFPPDIMREIFILSNYYSALHPKSNRGDNYWNEVDR